MSNLNIFLRQVRSRSLEHRQAMSVLESLGLSAVMVSLLRQELDSMVRVIYLLNQSLEQREDLIDASVCGKRWKKTTTKGRTTYITDSDMVAIATGLQGWTQSVYKFGCAFIHLSNLHDYSDRDPLAELPENERADIIQHCRTYHRGPETDEPSFADFAVYIPRILDKISRNLECYLSYLEKGDELDSH